MARKLYFEKSSPKMGLQKAPQALRWLENSTLQNQGPKMGPQKAPQALQWFENRTLNIRLATNAVMPLQHILHY